MLEDWHLKQVVNNCTDSAIEELLEASNLGMDYADWGRFNTDPDLALDDYLMTFLLNYDMPITERNKEDVKANYIKAFCVVGYDGYYIYDLRTDLVDNGLLHKDVEYNLISSPKMPFLYKDERDDRYVTYALNMGFKRCYRVTDATLSVVNSPLSQEETLKIINTRVSDDLMQRVDRAYENNWLESVYIPTSLSTLSSTNAIESPTVMCFMDGVDLNSYTKVNAFGIGGSRAKVSRPVAAYQRIVNGSPMKFYAYHDLLPDTLPNGDSFNTVIEEMFMSPQEAAAAGYYHDPLYMN